jgi:hypothetical protein
MSRVDEVVAKVLALRQLAKDTGTITRRSQSVLLRTLNEQELIEASMKLTEVKRG